MGRRMRVVAGAVVLAVAARTAYEAAPRPRLRFTGAVRVSPEPVLARAPWDHDGPLLLVAPRSTVWVRIVNDSGFRVRVEFPEERGPGFRTGAPAAVTLPAHGSADVALTFVFDCGVAPTVRNRSGVVSQDALRVRAHAWLRTRTFHAPLPVAVGSRQGGCR